MASSACLTCKSCAYLVTTVHQLSCEDFKSRLNVVNSNTVARLNKLTIVLLKSVQFE